MPDQLDYIDNYFTGTPTVEEKAEFEKRLATENDFAEEVSLYLATLNVFKEDIAEEKKKRFREIYKKETPVKKLSPVRKLRPYLSVAAALVAVMLGWYVFVNPTSPQQMADKYIRTELQQIKATSMGAEDDKQLAIQLFNKGNYSEALQKFEKLLSLDTSNLDLKEYAGNASLHLNEYDKALGYFKKMENQQGAFTNPAVFYQALTLMKRNLPGDKQTAKDLLQNIVDNNLDKKEKAEEWLKKF